ncbi:MAG: aminopeptidase, partial [Clostridia bacterium]|nr:aminopeptidase [Clostridia bacterium]
MQTKNAWLGYDKAQLDALEELSKGYIDFLSDGKTERECTTLLVEMAKKKGYRDLNEIIANGESLKQGDKVYAVNMKKALMLLNIGEDIIRDGLNILGGHIDSPRLDIKQNPLYESDELAYFDTHYYGGIKKYQWVTLPLALHGVVAKTNGEIVEINVGEDPADPVFFVSDLLPHLSDEQDKRTLRNGIKGDDLDILVGSKPVEGEDGETVKANILNILKEKYDFEEKDLASAEIEVVPAGRAREAGFDRSMILSYGHDDRCCSYTSAVAMLEIENPKTTACGLFVDKEEIGSVGATGMESHFFEDTMREVLDRMGIYSELNLTRVFRHSKMLSSDVNSAFDPIYADAFNKNSASYFGHGIVFNKFTGARGKSGSNDANAEYIGKLRSYFDAHDVTYQFAELGKVDLGGGGTIAYILSLYGMEVIDSGIAVLSMHAPWEAISKSDLYEAYRAYKAFLLEGK